MAKPADPVIAMLGSVDIFEGLSNKHLATLRDAVREKTVAAGETIVREGEHDRRFYLIVEGDAVITLGGNPVRTLGPGQYFGEISVLDGGERTATVTALTQVKVLTLAHFNIRALLQEHPDVALKLLVGLCGVVRRSASRAAAH